MNLMIPINLWQEGLVEIREDYVEEASSKEASKIGMFHLLLIYVLHIVELMLMFITRLVIFFFLISKSIFKCFCYQNQGRS